MIYKNCTKKRGFTLIELLVVVAILGVLAAIAVPQFRGYVAQSKSGAVHGNHKNILALITSEFAKCSGGATNSIMGTVTTICTAGVDTFAANIKTYLDGENVQNPYLPNSSAIIVGAAGTTEGVTYLTADVPNNAITVTSISSSTETLTGNIFKE